MLHSADPALIKDASALTHQQCLQLHDSSDEQGSELPSSDTLEASPEDSPAMVSTHSVPSLCCQCYPSWGPKPMIPSAVVSTQESQVRTVLVPSDSSTTVIKSTTAPYLRTEADICLLALNGTAGDSQNINAVWDRGMRKRERVYL